MRLAISHINIATKKFHTEPRGKAVKKTQKQQINTINMEQIEFIASLDATPKASTVVEENKAATALTVTASKPEAEGLETPTVWPTKHPTTALDVKESDESNEPDPAVIANRAAKIEKMLAKDKALSDAERKDRDRLAEIVKKGFDHAKLANEALREIRDRRLWRETHKSFRDYCDEVLDTSEQRVSQLLQCADEIAQLQGKVPDGLIPTSERAIRALRRVKKSNRVAVLEIAAGLSDTGQPNSTTIETARIQIEGTLEQRAKDGAIKAEAALKAAKLVEKFIEDCDLNDQKLGEIKELRDLINAISKDAEKLVPTA